MQVHIMICFWVIALPPSLAQLTQKQIIIICIYLFAVKISNYVCICTYLLFPSKPPVSYHANLELLLFNIYFYSILPTAKLQHSIQILEWIKCLYCDVYFGRPTDCIKDQCTTEIKRSFINIIAICIFYITTSALRKTYFVVY